jgi:glycosyltransferase involved in cell wall biosynthesis
MPTTLTIDTPGVFFTPMDEPVRAPVAPVRVLHVINGEHYAGAERVQDLLALRLPQFGFEVSFASLKPGQFDARRQAKESPLFDAHMRSRLDVRVAWRLAERIRADGYALVHAHTPRSALVGRLASWLAGVPMVYHVHSPSVRDTTHAWRNHANAWIERASLFGVPRLIAVSESLGRHLRGIGYTAERITVIHNGVPGATKMAQRAAPRDSWTLGVVALFRPRKGLEMLLEALAFLKNQDRSVRLRAVGTFESPDYEHEIHRRAAELGMLDAIDWVGFASDVPAELAKIDVLVLPSLFGEGLPMVVLEAMAHGAVVVASAVEGVPEAIHDRIDGLLVPPGDSVALAGALTELMTGRVSWSALGRAALERHALQFSDVTMAKAVAGVYREILDRTEGLYGLRPRG